MALSEALSVCDRISLKLRSPFRAGCQVVVAQLSGGEAVHRLGVAQRPGQRLDEQRTRWSGAVARRSRAEVTGARPATAPARCKRWSRRSGQRSTSLARRAGCRPRVAGTAFGPRIGALIDRDDELRRLLQEAHQLGFGRFHFARPFKRSSKSVVVILSPSVSVPARLLRRQSQYGRRVPEVPALRCHSLRAMLVTLAHLSTVSIAPSATEFPIYSLYFM